MSAFATLLGVLLLIALPVAASSLFYRPELTIWPILTLSGLTGWMLSQAYRFGPNWLVPATYVSIGLSLAVMVYRLVQRLRSYDKAPGHQPQDN